MGALSSHVLLIGWLQPKADGQLCGQRHSLIDLHRLTPQGSVLLTLKGFRPPVNHITLKNDKQNSSVI